MEIGEWKKAKIGEVTVIGYVSRIDYYESQIEIAIVGRIKNGIMKWGTPTRLLFREHRLEPLGTLLDDIQDKTALIDLALMTKDRKWFEELTGGLKNGIPRSSKSATMDT
ncbi:IDEAL domain-containing protein [Domibacillus sp. DTU_2020_1001157_1_SI_ALB_TIR_016]|uniref:IDEAL domain-containing protein n=1 Tax=Domibacillus sp. DTU_2020_1001157_1_SI_ALB_TIR_016 TaxID=3077789 RepID=UPI0028ECEA5D|nr:IDEAL domain-containing protein [Domibacillus sp. DTU_2020_1001157_1_SI_ALB_TIR_016]WNS79425.1 IDEAL domain-containing protein [Domibacillus sp. DTU_2020_1001157_1_SI_ALB_TIR_016]